MKILRIIRLLFALLITFFCLEAVNPHLLLLVKIKKYNTHENTPSLTLLLNYVKTIKNMHYSVIFKENNGEMYREERALSYADFCSLLYQSENIIPLFIDSMLEDSSNQEERFYIKILKNQFKQYGWYVFKDEKSDKRELWPKNIAIKTNEKKRKVEQEIPNKYNKKKRFIKLIE